ncbi:competence/damage-inducible protein A [Hydrogenibacillus schlegelii]|uniref:Putative competence-damage inducible protein n=1 Tax=Hydrogenibacillus schlegelii TaxID=1484 RepID=A0A179ILY2_HYDSH|nr:competence/damage-inducible protein A [Hydrogenibacillus schlegelii]OAR03687.1 hypothetical protein SA87_00400 [Hydrogenibacillus schlegelii]
MSGHGTSGPIGRPRGEIIAVGTELLTGQTLNTNAAWLSRRLAEAGVDVLFHTAVGDNLERLQATFSLAAGRSDVVVVTGGLGPTEDDVTREALALFAGRPLVKDRAALENVRRFFARTGRPLLPINVRQAEVLLESRVLPNDVGLAAGFAFDVGGTHFIVLPGPPREMQVMFERYARSELLAWLAGRGWTIQPLFHRFLHFAGIGESAVADRLADLIRHQTDPTIAVYAEPGHVLVRLSTRRPDERQAAEALEPLMDAIVARLKGHYFGEGEALTLAEAVIGRLKGQGLTLAVAESCTGGRILDALIAVPGASAVVRLGVLPYQTPMKAAVLGLDADGLAEHGAVSAWAAEAMARAVRRLSAAEVGLATTCVAGPEPQEGRPVGEGYIGLAVADRVWSLAVRADGDRNLIRQRIADQALFALFRAVAPSSEPDGENPDRKGEERE